MVLLNNIIIGANIGAKRRGKITAGGGKKFAGYNSSAI
jgi:hypothetical protein